MQHRLDALTGLRFFAALLIVFHHLPGNLWFPLGSINWLNTGSGVSFFFVLSGYILHLNYRDKIADIPKWRFFALRYFRLWPAHLAALALVLFLAPNWWMTWLPANLSPVELMSHIFMFQWAFPDQRVYFAWNGVSWSIATEFAFYLAFPLLCVQIARRPVWPSVAVITFVVFYLTLVETVFYEPDVPGNMTGLVYISPFSRILEFTAGMLACEMAVFRHPTRWRGWRGTEWLALFVALACLWLSTYVPLLIGGIGDAFRHYVWIACLTPLFCAFIVVISRQSGPVSSFLSSPALVWLGNISFSLYLVHQPIIIFFKVHLGDLLWWQQVPLFVLFCIGLSALIYRWIEMPTHASARSILLNRKRQIGLMRKA